MQNPKLVAHRGYAGAYPENSMSAFYAAIECGCQYLELDVQITKDKKAVVIHDTNLQRTGKSNKDILECDWSDLENETIGEVDRLGDTYKNEKLPTLGDFVFLLKNNPTVSAFVEIKEECIERFGAKTVLDIVCKTIEPVKEQCFIISFDDDVLFETKKTTALPIGFVMHKYDDMHLDIANKLLPDILICNYKKIPDHDGSLWMGEWDWFLYEIVEADIAKRWSRRGVKYIETMEIASMMRAMA